MTNNKDKESICSKISNLFSQLEGALSGDVTTDIKVPTGVIPTVEQILPKYGFVKDHTMRRNIAYAVEFLEYVGWLLRRFGIYGPVQSYLIKVGMTVVYSIIEAIIWDQQSYCELRPGKKLGGNLMKLQSDLAVDEKLCKRIRELNQKRSNIHLSQIRGLEASKYSLDDWTSARQLLEDLREDFT